MNKREIVYITQESAFNTPVASPTIGTDQFCIRLENNGFVANQDPVIVSVGRGGGWASNAYAKSARTTVTGSISTKLCFSQAKPLLDWALTRKVSGTPDTPFESTEPVGDLLSYTIDRKIWHEGLNDYKYFRWTGAKISTLALDANNSDDIPTLNLDWTASTPVAITSADFPVFSESHLPTDAVLFRQCSANVTIGTSRTNISSFSLNVQNALDAAFFESQYVSIIRSVGRTANASFELLLKGTPDDFSSYQSLTPQDVVVAFTNGTNTITFDLNENNIIRALPFNLNPDGLYTRTLEVDNYFDATAGADLAFTYA